MSVKQEADGRRSVEEEFDVHGTPEEVWQAIATGPGVSAWFVPTEFELRDGKPVAVNYKFGPGMDIRGDVIAWDPPRTFAARQVEAWGDAPPMATEWSVEARAGGVCRVRIVHSLFASTDAWDDQLEGAKGGWAGFLAILRVYLAHFRGQQGAIMQVTTPIAISEAQAWETLTAAMGMQGLATGQRWSTPAGISPLAGVLEFVTENPNDALLRLDAPGPGIVALGTATYPGGARMVAMNLYAYGEQAAATVARETPRWQAFLQQRFPLPAELADG
jgi:uncharacterized protein YndB with AHSA1/START domain